MLGGQAGEWLARRRNRGPLVVDGHLLVAAQDRVASERYDDAHQVSDVTTASCLAMW